MKSLKNGIGWLGWMSLTLVAAGTVTALWIVPPDGVMGDVQRLMYVHVPTAWLAMLAFFIVFLMSVLYLVQRKPRWDHVAVSAAEIGVVFTALTLALGSLWGRPTWGVWWTWDPRLTTTAIMLAMYVGYLAVRGFAEEPERRARWAAVVGIVGFVNVPIVYLSVVWWRTLHQPPSSPRSMAPEFMWTLLVNLLGFTVLFAYLMHRRVHLSQLEEQLERRGPGHIAHTAAGAL
ncbi:MAG: cytochrome c biogenesis protein CcsA [Gemmatimonadota bacterium]